MSSTSIFITPSITSPFMFSSVHPSFFLFCATFFLFVCDVTFPLYYVLLSVSVTSPSFQSFCDPFISHASSIITPLVYLSCHHPSISTYLSHVTSLHFVSPMIVFFLRYNFFLLSCFLHSIVRLYPFFIPPSICSPTFQPSRS